MTAPNVSAFTAARRPRTNLGSRSDGWLPGAGPRPDVGSAYSQINGQSAAGNGGATPPTAGAGQPTSTFSATNNLIGTQINPTASGQTRQAQRATTGAMNSYLAQPTGTGVSTTPGAGTQQLQGQAQGAATAYAGAGGPPNLTNPTFNTIGANTYGAARTTLSSMANGTLGGAQGGSFGYAGDTGAARGMAMDQLKKTLTTTPDRAQLGADALKLYEEQSQPGYEQGLRKLGQKAAALGRVGSGMTTNELTDLSLARERDLGQQRRILAMDAADKSLADQRAKLDAATGTAGQFGSMDVAGGNLNLGYLGESNRASAQNADVRYRGAMGAADLEARSRGEAVSERDAAYRAGQDANDLSLTLDNTRFSRLRGQATDLAGMANDSSANDLRWGQFASDQNEIGYQRGRQKFTDLATYQTGREAYDRQNANDLRGERDYQYGLDRNAVADARDERLLQEELLNGRFRRGQSLYGTGSQNDPTGVYQGAANYAGNAAGQYGQQASAGYGGAADAATQWAYNRARMRQQTGPRTDGARTTYPQTYSNYGGGIDA